MKQRNMTNTFLVLAVDWLFECRDVFGVSVLSHRVLFRFLSVACHWLNSFIGLVRRNLNPIYLLQGPGTVHVDPLSHCHELLRLILSASDSCGEPAKEP